jgi:hypothetical protein
MGVTSRKGKGKGVPAAAAAAAAVDGGGKDGGLAAGAMGSETTPSAEAQRAATSWLSAAD